jgi:hypothetical protein
MQPGGRRPAAATAWYRLAAVLRRDRGGYLAIALIVGIIGGVGMGSVATARRTQSAFPRILAASNPSDLDVSPPGGYDPRAMARILSLPHVASGKAYVALYGLRALRSGFADYQDPFNQQVELVASLDGLYFSQDRVIITRGRRARPDRPGEVVVSEQTADRFGLHVGQSLTMNFYSGQEANDPDYDPMTRPPLRRVRLAVTGVGVFTDEVVQDDIDRIDRVLGTPALARQELGCCGWYTWVGLRLGRGGRDVAAVQREYIRLLPPGAQQSFRVTSAVEGQGERAIRPESVAAGVLGLIAGLAAIVLALQAIRRMVAGRRPERAVLRALGASPLAIGLDSGIGAVAAAGLGVLLAVGVAVALSPLAPLGQLHRLEPGPGISADWTVLGAGAAFLLLVLAGATALLAYAEATRRFERRDDIPRRPAAAAAPPGLPAAAMVGIGFAFGPGAGRSARPARPGITGTVVALVILVGSLIFGASLGNLVSHPALYGWTWDRELLAGDGYGNIPLPLAGRLLSGDPDVAAWSGAYFDSVEINGRSVPVIGTAGSQVYPPILAGHRPAGPRQIVLGQETLAEVGGRVGGTVRVFTGERTLDMRVAGTATLPAIGIGHGIHPSLGLGALLPSSVLPRVVLTGGSSDRAFQGPNTILVRFRPGVSPAAAVRRLDRIGAVLAASQSALGIQVLPVQRPAEIVNYKTMGAAPLILAGLLAAAAVVALMVTLGTSARRRSRDFALLKTLGFVRRQIIAVVIWQAAVSVALGAAIGIPLGVVTGRLLWDRFATELYVVPRPFISLATIAGVAAAALALAVLTAIVPGWLAGRTRVTPALRAE